MIPCDFLQYPERRNERGWPANVCQRCGYERYSPDHPSKWGGDPQYCHAWPRWWEVGCKTTILLASCGIRKSKKGKCGCIKREAALNAIGSLFAAFLRRLSGVLKLPPIKHKIQRLLHHLRQ